jgi:carboxylesterase type B
LDVFVPIDVFNKTSRTSGIPVLVWLYGGGNVYGAKDYQTDPYGLMLRAQEHSPDGMIFVAMNYRLGAFGWLTGPTFQKDGTANVGLHDQRMALEWVQKYIHLFGGDRSRVTAMGYSAGGGSVVHQLTVCWTPIL